MFILLPRSRLPTAALSIGKDRDFGRGDLGRRGVSCDRVLANERHELVDAKEPVRSGRVSAKMASAERALWLDSRPGNHSVPSPLPPASSSWSQASVLLPGCPAAGDCVENAATVSHTNSPNMS